jgi:hypothetical protein
MDRTSSEASNQSINSSIQTSTLLRLETREEKLNAGDPHQQRKEAGVLTNRKSIKDDGAHSPSLPHTGRQAITARGWARCCRASASRVRLNVCLCFPNPGIKDTYLPYHIPHHPTPSPPQTKQGTEALWVALHGFAFALVALSVGLEHLSPAGVAALLAGGGTYLLTLAEMAEHATLLDWA